MPTITQWVDKFDAERPVGNMLETPIVLAQAIAAANFYAGHGALSEHLDIPLADPAPDPPAQYPEITPNTNITVSEWALIRPLFLLYVERENALYLEASRGLGIDPYGRSSSEIAGEIQQLELEIPHKAFQRDVITI